MEGRGRVSEGAMGRGVSLDLTRSKASVREPATKCHIDTVR